MFDQYYTVLRVPTYLCSSAPLAALAQYRQFERSMLNFVDGGGDITVIWGDAGLETGDAPGLGYRFHADSGLAPALFLPDGYLLGAANNRPSGASNWFRLFLTRRVVARPVPAADNNLSGGATPLPMAIPFRRKAALAGGGWAVPVQARGRRFEATGWTAMARRLELIGQPFRAQISLRQADPLVVVQDARTADALWRLAEGRFNRRSMAKNTREVLHERLRYTPPAYQVKIEVAAGDENVVQPIALTVAAALGGVEAYRVNDATVDDPYMSAHQNRVSALDSARRWCREQHVDPNGLDAHESSFIAGLPHLISLPQAASFLALPYGLSGESLPMLATKPLVVFPSTGVDCRPVIGVGWDRGAIPVGMVVDPQHPFSGPDFSRMLESTQSEDLRGSKMLAYPSRDFCGMTILTGKPGSGKTTAINTIASYAGVRGSDNETPVQLVFIDLLKGNVYEDVKSLIPNVVRYIASEVRPGEDQTLPLMFEVFQPPPGTAVGSWIDWLKEVLPSTINLSPFTVGTFRSAIGDYYSTLKVSSRADGGPGILRQLEDQPGLGRFIDFFMKRVPDALQGLTDDRKQEFLSFYKRVVDDLQSGGLGRASKANDQFLREQMQWCGNRKDGQTTVAPQPSAPMMTAFQQPIELIFERPCVIDVSGIPDSSQRAQLGLAILSYIMMGAKASIEQRKVARHGPLRLLIVIDECHALFPARSGIPRGTEVYGKDVGTLAVEFGQSMTATCRDAGIGILLATQTFEQVDSTIANLARSIIAMRQESPDSIDHLRKSMGLSPEQAKLLRRLEVGQAIVTSSSLNEPYLVAIPDSWLNKDALSF